MPSVSPITKSSVTKYLLKNKFHAVKQDSNPFWKHHDLYFYGENGDYLGEMMVHPKEGGIEVHKLIFEEKLKEGRELFYDGSENIIRFRNLNLINKIKFNNF